MHIGTPCKRSHESMHCASNKISSNAQGVGCDEKVNKCVVYIFSEYVCIPSQVIYTNKKVAKFADVNVKIENVIKYDN